MRSVSHHLLLALSLTAVVALAAGLAGCGDDDQETTTAATARTVADVPPAKAPEALDVAQFSTINRGAERVVKDLTAIGNATTACARTATERSAIAACVSRRLDKATAELDDLAGSVVEVSRTVHGACQNDLQRFAQDIKDLAGTFASASKSLVAGDGAKATDTLKGLQLDAVSASGTAAQTSCKPG